MLNQNHLRTLIIPTLVLVWVIAMGYLVPQTAFAHADVESSNPSAHSSAAQSPPKVTATFSEELEPAFSKMTVVNGNGEDVTTGKSGAIEHNKGLEVPLKLNLPAGSYTVKWETLAVDGHKEQGNFVFALTGNAGKTDPQSQQSNVNALSTSDGNSEPGSSNASEAPAQGGGFNGWYILIFVAAVAVIFLMIKRRRKS